MAAENADDSMLRSRAGLLLRAGTALGGIFLAAGLLQALAGKPLAAEAWIKPGILIMISTPVARVALIAADFGLNRRWRFCGVSAAVLALLVGGILFGLSR